MWSHLFDPGTHCFLIKEGHLLRVSRRLQINVYCSHSDTFTYNSIWNMLPDVPLTSPAPVACYLLQHSVWRTPMIKFCSHCSGQSICRLVLVLIDYWLVDVAVVKWNSPYLLPPYRCSLTLSLYKLSRELNLYHRWSLLLQGNDCWAPSPTFPPPPSVSFFPPPFLAFALFPTVSLHVSFTSPTFHPSPLLPPLSSPPPPLPPFPLFPSFPSLTPLAAHMPSISLLSS